MLSIVVPVFNAEKYIRQCIDSVLLQSYKDIELILVDDGSSDNSLTICREYENSDSRIKVIIGDHQGTYYARRVGVENVTGDYLSFVDADDYISENAYAMSERDMGEEVDIISFDIFRYYDDERISYEKCPMPEGVYNQHKMKEIIFPAMIWDEDRKSFGIDPSLCNKIYKTSLLKNHYRVLKNANFHYGEDVAVIYTLITKASLLSIHHEAYYYHRQRKNGELPAYIRDKQYLDKLYKLYRYLSDSMSFDDMFQRQIDLFYIHSVEFAKKKYGIFKYPENEIFPFDKVEKKDKVVIYGAGNVGRLYVKQLELLDYCEVRLWVDKNHNGLGNQVCAPEKILQTDYDKIVIAIANQTMRENVMKYLIGLGVNSDYII